MYVFQSICQYIDTIFTFQSYIFSIILLVIFVIVTWPTLAGHERYEMNARRLFKLAADSIMEYYKEGYEERIINELKSVR